jgi:WD40 repeat protein
VLSLAMLSERISALEWKDVILYGGRNCEVHVFDIRSPLSVGILHSGRAEICGIKQHGNLIAFGNNNNAVVIFDMRKAQMIDKYYHMACVKALCWDRQGENLYSGGGCTDRKILKWSAKEYVISSIQKPVMSW